MAWIFASSEPKLIVAGNPRTIHTMAANRLLVSIAALSSGTTLLIQGAAAQIEGVGETYNTPAEDYAIRERKQSAVNFSTDPFQVCNSMAGTGNPFWAWLILL